MSFQTQTPADLAIHPRNISFARAASAARWWLGGDPIATAFYNALSASFPQGERFFMDAIRVYRDRADPKLREQIAAFTAQEAVHTREHIAFNRHAEQHGFDFSRIDSYLRKRFDFGRKLPHLNQLCATAALEHFTAILAHALLSGGGDFARAPAEIRQMWHWHAIEEIEHKAVAFETYLTAAQRHSRFRRWQIRCVAMVIVTGMFLRFLVFAVREFFRHDGVDTLRSCRALLHYLWIEPGLFRRAAPNYFAYYRPGFHPWQLDDRALIADVDAQLEQEGLAPAPA